MKIRTAARNALLALVVGSLIYMAYTEFSGRTNAKVMLPDEASVTAATKLIVYYFSEGKECFTCEQIPAFTHEALTKDFAAEMSSGVIVWRTIDVDEPKFLNYTAKTEIYTKSIVIARVQDGKQLDWRNLDRVWDLVYDKQGFIDYIRTELRTELDSAS